MLQVRNLSKSFSGADGPVQVLRGVDMDLSAGETLALTGESGSGKSTLLHLVGGLDESDGGSILLDGADVTAMDDVARAQVRREKVGVIFQQFNLVPSLDVAANIAFQARLAGRHDPAYAAGLADKMGLADQLRKFPEDLSGGQQQRVAVARALAAKPALILADEPTGNLDEDTADKVLDLMLDLVREAGAALLMVTHSERIAARLGRRLHLAKGQLA